MKLRVFFQSILTVVLAFVGFSCQEEGDEYGCPSADFVLKGHVVNQKGEPVPEVGIKTVSTWYLDEDQGDSLRTYDTIFDGRFTRLAYLDSSRVFVKTDERGDYLFKCDYYEYDILNVYSSDVESYLFRFVGDTSLYEPFDTLVPVNSIHFTGGDGNWYSGKATVNLDVVLKDKKQ